MIELIVGVVVGELLGAHWGLPRAVVWALDGLLVAVIYPVSAWLWPCRPCPLLWVGWLHATRFRGPRRRYRPRAAAWCPLCHGGDYVLLLARLMAGRDD